MSDITPCEPSERMPVVVFHGADDRFASFDGGLGAAAVEALQAIGVDVETTEGTPRAELVAAWAERNGCGGGSTESKPAEGARLVNYDCPPGADVEFYILEGAGHTWPGSEFSASVGGLAGPTNMNLDATETLNGAQPCLGRLPDRSTR